MSRKTQHTNFEDKIWENLLMRTSRKLYNPVIKLSNKVNRVPPSASAKQSGRTSLHIVKHFKLCRDRCDRRSCKTFASCVQKTAHFLAIFARLAYTTVCILSVSESQKSIQFYHGVFLEGCMLSASMWRHTTDQETQGLGCGGHWPGWPKNIYPRAQHRLLGRSDPSRKRSPSDILWQISVYSLPVV